MALGEIAYLSPWMFVPLVGGSSAAGATGGDERRLFLLCLALPPIVLFTLTPLWGARGLPHWTMPGWFFAFPLLGAWVDEPGDRRPRSAALGGRLRRRCSRRSPRSSPCRRRPAGPARVSAPPGVADPTLEAFDWRALRDAPLLDPPPAFVVSTRWSDAGKIALALGPRRSRLRAVRRSARLGLRRRRARVCSAATA